MYRKKSPNLSHFTPHPSPCGSISALQASIDDRLANLFPHFDKDDVEGQAARAAATSHIFGAWAQGTNNKSTVTRGVSS